MEILIKRIREIDFPSYHHPDDSGIDLVNAHEDTSIEPGERRLIPTGIIVAIPEGYELQVRSRSGLALKKGVMVLNSPGTIDAGYRGEIGVILFNTSDETVSIPKGFRVAQAVLQKVEKINWKEVDILPDSKRGPGGFGSTGF